MSFYILLTFSSLLLGLCIMFLDKKVFKLGDSNLSAQQASHLTPTSRLGGAAILIPAAVFAFFLNGFVGWELFVTVLPLFFIGFLEDIGVHSSPRLRLIVAAICAATGIYLYGAWLNNIDTAGLDWFLSFKAIGILFTIFAIVGLVNAVNLIDGVNGLACGQVIISAFAISIISTKVGETNISSLALLIAFATLGLFLLNYPFGFLFIGDAGAYTLGFLLAWMLVLLSYRHPELSDWALLAIVIWPVSETLLAVFRRKINSTSAGQADRRHFHQLIMRAWQIISKGKISGKVANPLSTTTILPFIALPATGGVLLCFDGTSSAFLVIGSIIFFFTTYFCISYIVLIRKQENY